MNKTAGRCLAALAFGVALSAMTAADGWAQMIPGMPTGTGNIASGRGAQGAAREKPPEAPPDAVPGARARQPAAPMTRAASDMQPTDALFDAINRGDIVSARDALSRGADLNGVNVLGMTPLELSVDLGRNDITFLLLSMRGEDGGRGSRAAVHPAAPEAPPARTVQAKGVPARPHVAAARSAPVGAKPVAGRPVATPKLFANDGGTPLPSAGFLGFGPHSASD